MLLLTEKLHFKIGLSGVYWERKPQYTILINDKIVSTGMINVSTGTFDKESKKIVYDEMQFEEFDADVPEGPCILKIRFENKTDLDVVKDDPTNENYKIIKDMLLGIRSIEIDDVEMGNLIWSKSQFVPDDPRHPILDNCVDLGWNGAWNLPFDSPFYIWLLENI